MTSSSSEGEGDDITLNLRENPTPLPHPSPQHAKQQQSPHRPSSQNTAPPQTLIEGASPAPPRKLSTPFYTGSGAVTPVDSPSIPRRPLVYTQHTQGKENLLYMHNQKFQSIIHVHVQSGVPEAHKIL